MSNENQNVLTDKISKIRENTELFNLLLHHLHSNCTFNEFKNPYRSCRKTFLIYKKQSQILYKIGVNSINRYDTRLIKEICLNLNELLPAYLPLQNQNQDEGEELDLIMLNYKIKNIKNHLSNIDLDEHGKMNFSQNVLSISKIPSRISSVISLYKLTKINNETLYDFLCRNSDLNIIIRKNIQTKKGIDLNVKYIQTLRIFILSFLEIQLLYHAKKHPECGIIDLHDHTLIDHIFNKTISI